MARPSETEPTPSEWIAAYLTLARGPAYLGFDCIEWPFANTNGYGSVAHEGRVSKVTHLVLEATGRPRPAAPKDHALHSCDNPPCIHPGHLRWGTHQQNMDDRWSRPRSSPQPVE